MHLHKYKPIHRARKRPVYYSFLGLPMAVHSESTGWEKCVRCGKRKKESPPSAMLFVAVALVALGAFVCLSLI